MILGKKFNGTKTLVLAIICIASRLIIDLSLANPEFERSPVGSFNSPSSSFLDQQLADIKTRPEIELNRISGSSSRRFSDSPRRESPMHHFDSSKCLYLYTKDRKFGLSLKETTECIKRRYESLKVSTEYPDLLLELQHLMQIAEPLSELESPNSWENGCSSEQVAIVFNLIEELLTKNEGCFNIRAYLKYHKGIQIFKCNESLRTEVIQKLSLFYGTKQVDYTFLVHVYHNFAKNIANIKEFAIRREPNWTHNAIKQVAIASLDTLIENHELAFSNDHRTCLFEWDFFEHSIDRSLKHHCTQMQLILDPELTNYQTFLELYANANNLGSHDELRVWLTLNNYCKLIIGDSFKGEQIHKIAFGTFKMRNFFPFLGAKLNSAFLNCLTGSNEAQRDSMAQFNAAPVTMNSLEFDLRARHQRRQPQSHLPSTAPIPITSHSHNEWTESGL